MGNACSDQNKVANSVDDGATRSNVLMKFEGLGSELKETKPAEAEKSVDDVPLQGETDPKTLKLHSIGSFVYSNTEISESDLYTDTETDYSDSDYYDEYDTDNDEYEYIEVSEYEVTESENEKTDKAIACLDKQAWKNKPQLSEVVEDYENPDGIVLKESSGANNIANIINAKIVTKKWRRKITSVSPVVEQTRRDSSMIGVFSAIRLSTKWKNKMNRRRLDQDGNMDALSTISVARKWKKKLRHVKSKIKKKNQETDNINAAQITHKWKSHMRRSQQMRSASEAGDFAEDGTRKSQGSHKLRRRRSSTKTDNEATDLENAAAVVSRKWKNTNVNKAIEEKEEG